MASRRGRLSGQALARSEPTFTWMAYLHRRETVPSEAEGLDLLAAGLALAIEEPSVAIGPPTARELAV